MAYIIGQIVDDGRGMQELDHEKLIENVRACEALYVSSHLKYSDNRYKENVWKEIGNRIQQPAVICKKTWTNLRDSFRRSLRKKRCITNGRVPSKIKKWKFEDEMSFLIPHLQERESSSNLDRDPDDVNDDEDNEYSEGADRNDYSHDSREHNVKDIDIDADIVEESDFNNSHIEELGRKKATNRKIGKQGNGNRGHKFDAEPVLIEYLLGDKRNAMAQSSQQRDGESNAIDMFFASIASTVKNFSPYYQNIAKSKIFNIITEIEMKQIIQCRQEQLDSPSTSMRRTSYAPMSNTISPEMLESYHSGPYDGCSAQSVSPSTIACPSSSSSQHFPRTVPMTFDEEIEIKKE